MPIFPEPYAPFLMRGDFSDVYLEESSHLSLRWEAGRLEDVVQGTSSGVGVRYWRGRETFYGHVDGRRPVTEGLRADERDRLAALASKLARHLPLAGKKMSWTYRPARRHEVRAYPETVALEKKVQCLERAERAARRFRAVSQVTLSYAERTKRVGYINSDGEVCGEERVYVIFAAEVTAKKDRLLQTGYESAGGLQGFELFETSRPEDVAERAARRAVAKLKAPAAPAGEMAVVISSQAGGTLIHEAIGHALEADGVRQGTSPHFAHKIGRAVAGEIVTVLDDPTRPGQRGSFFYDDEGTPAERTVLVENGILRTYLYDRRTAARERRPSNGHGRRESYAHKPIPRMSNTFIAPGKESPSDIRASLKSGLFVTRMGGGQVNTATGDFVFEVEEAFRVENGRVKNLVRGASLLGNGPEVLRSIDRVGSDLGWSIGTCGKEGQGVPVSDGVPTLRIPKLVIGGTQNGG